MFNNRKTLIFAVLGAAVGLFLVFYFGIPRFSGSADGLADYSHPAFGVSLKYPAEWIVDVDGAAFQGIPLRFVGDEGYFGIDAVSAAGLDGEALTLELFAERAIKPYESDDGTIAPYGSEPTVRAVVFGGVEARLILPSADQPQSSNNEAVFIAEYPRELKIGDNLYKFFMLYAHKDYLANIAETIRFNLPL